MKKTCILFTLLLLSFNGTILSQEGMIKAFPFQENDMKLERLAQPGTPFDKVGRKFAVLGFESGLLEAWAYPVKLFRNFNFSFFLGSSTVPIRSGDIVRRIEVTPAVTILTFTYQSFTAKAHTITPIDEAGSLILLEIDSTEPLKIVCGFLPILQPMWPAGIGGQYAYWNGELKAYIISEPTRMNHGLIGSPAAEGMSYTPAHMLSDVPSEFRIDIPEPEKTAGKFIPIIMAGGKGDREAVIQLYKNLTADPEAYYQKTAAYYKTLREKTLHIRTPNPEINLALEWAKVAYDNLVVDNPDLGKGMVAGLAASGTSGRPGFGWFFGGDTYINSFSMNSYGTYNTVRDVLEFTIQFQRKDGKMPHEVSQAAGYIDWFGKYPYGYIHGDTSPYFVVAVHDYVKMSGDIDFARSHWKTLQRAYEWSLATDENGDGLMDNRKAGLGALEYGKLTGGIATDIYVGAVWVKATQAMEDLATWIGKKGFARKVKKHRKKAEQAFRDKFWDEDTQFYSYAFSEEGDHVPEFSPWNAVGLMWELGEPERSIKTLERLSSSELTTDWGVRSISGKSSYYQALNYNYGAVWPFLNSWVATAQFKHHLFLQGYATLMSTVRHVFTNQLGAVGEVFSGSLHTWPQESVGHQGFSTAGTVLPLVRGLLGLEGDAVRKNVQFAPHFPADWNETAIEHYRIGPASFAFYFKREKDRIWINISSHQAEGFTLSLAPALGIGTEIQKVLIDGVETTFNLHKSPQTVQPLVRLPIKKEKYGVEIVFLPTVEIIPPENKSRVGDSNQGLRILSVKKLDGRLLVTCEGLSDRTYALGLVNSECIQSVENGKFEGERLLITFPAGEAGEYVETNVSLGLK